LSMTITEQMYLNLGIDFGLSAGKDERLREKLGTKAKQEKNFKFYSLYGHICNMDVLKVAWKTIYVSGAKDIINPPKGLTTTNMCTSWD
jgi:RNA-directed DNA polymerase